MKKDYILDNGKIRNCPSNRAKMNIFECMKVNKFYIENYLSNTQYALKEVKTGFLALLAILITTTMLLLFPISFPIIAMHQIKDAKKLVEKQKKIREGMRQ